MRCWKLLCKICLLNTVWNYFHQQHIMCMLIYIVLQPFAFVTFIGNVEDVGLLPSNIIFHAWIFIVLYLHTNLTGPTLHNCFCNIFFLRSPPVITAGMCRVASWFGQIGNFLWNYFRTEKLSYFSVKNKIILTDVFSFKFMLHQILKNYLYQLEEINEILNNF